ncbi:hypothetical protein H6P81_014750 [Aristolochia fimbriata]|uniref:Uncharacterized protein n=1 Tax=Aristolochia fimbriata TaxID=158543 RepID=A0AAV7E5K7_ARIFI|nr:hypothetical protein H6P81_014750 [Aristolochia fimbriata]
MSRLIPVPGSGSTAAHLPFSLPGVSNARGNSSINSLWSQPQAQTGICQAEGRQTKTNVPHWSSAAADRHLKSRIVPGKGDFSAAVTQSSSPAAPPACVYYQSWPCPSARLAAGGEYSYSCGCGSNRGRGLGDRDMGSSAARQSAGFGRDWSLVWAQPRCSNQGGSSSSMNQLPWELQPPADVGQIQGLPQVGRSRLHQSDPGSSSVGSGSWIMPYGTPGSEVFLAGSTAMGPISSPSPGVAWTMKSFDGGDDRRRLEGGHHQVIQSSFQGDPSQVILSFLDRQVGGPSGRVDPVGLSKQQVQNRQTGSLLAAGPDDLLTQFQSSGSREFELLYEPAMEYIYICKETCHKQHPSAQPQSERSKQQYYEGKLLFN